MRIDFSHLFESVVAIRGLGKMGARHAVRVASSALLLAAFLSAQSPARAEGLNTGFDASYWKKVRAAKGIPEPGTHQDSKAAEGNSGTPASSSGGAASAASGTPAVSASSPEVCSALEKEMTKLSCRFSETCGKLMGKCSKDQLTCKDAKCLATLRKKNKNKTNSKKDGKRGSSSTDAADDQETQVTKERTDNACDEACQQKFEAEKLAKEKEAISANGSSTGAGTSSAPATEPFALCVEEVKSGRVAYDRSGSSNWDPANIKRLCAGVTDSNQRVNCFRSKISQGISWESAIQECVSGISHATTTPSQPNPPANPPSITHATANAPTTDPLGLCVEELKSGRVAYDRSGSSNWDPANIKRLCTGVTDSTQRIGCFRGKISSGIGWSIAIDECVSGISHATTTPSQPNPPANPQRFTHDDASTPTAPSPFQEKTPQIITALERPGIQEKVLAAPSNLTKPAKQEVGAQQLPPSYTYLPAAQQEIKAQQIAPSYTLAPSTANAPVAQQISVSTQPPVVSATVQSAAQQASRQIAQTPPSVPTITAPSSIPSAKLNAKISAGQAQSQRISASGTPPSGWGNSACYSNSSSGVRVVCWYNSRVSGANCPVDQGYRPDAYNGGCYAPALDSVPTSTRCTSKNYQQPNISFCSDVPR